MFKLFSLCWLIMLCNGCVSNSLKPHHLVQKKSFKMEKLNRYAENMGCKMLKTGYMICPKSMNR